MLRASRTACTAILRILPPLPPLAARAASALPSLRGPAPMRTLQSMSAGSASAAHQQELPTLLGLLASKDAQLAALLASMDALRASKDTQVAAKDAQVVTLQAAKDAQVAAKDAQVATLQAAKDAQVATLQASLDAAKNAQLANQQELLTLSLQAQRDATFLAAALHASDTAHGIISVRATLERVIAELWQQFGMDKTAHATDRLRMLAKGAVVKSYVSDCAVANKMDPAKVMAALPGLYGNLSGPMHAPRLESETEKMVPIDAVLNGDPTALLLVSCLFKLTRRDLRLYRVVSGGARKAVVLTLKEPPVLPSAGASCSEEA